MSSPSNEKMYATLESALSHQAALNEALTQEKWDAKTKRQVTKNLEALRGMLGKVVRLKEDAPDQVASIKNVIQLVDAKLNGKPLQIEEYLEPDTSENLAA